MRNLGFFIAVVVVGLLLASCGGSGSAPTSTPTTTTIDAGKLYEANCIACHGANRQGVPNLGPALTPESLAGLSDTEIKDIISDGKLNTAMTPWQSILNSEEIDALVQLIKHTSP